MVGRGSISFWNDNWSGTVLEGPRSMDAQLTVWVALEQIDQLLLLILAQYHTEILRVSCKSDVADRLVFTLTKSGRFDTSVFWDLIRPHFPSLG